jgi:hypothetical protein
MAERRSDAGPSDAASRLAEIPIGPAGVASSRRAAVPASSAPAVPTAAPSIDEQAAPAATLPGRLPVTLRARRLGLRLALGGVMAATAALGMLVAPAAWQAWQNRHDRIVIPTRVGGLVIDDNPGTRDTVDQLRHAIEADIPVSTAGAVYADDAGQSRSVIFVAGTGSLASPQSSLDKALAITAGRLAGIRQMPTGSPGGVLKCGVLVTGGGPTSVCGWADNANVGIATFPNRGIEDSADLLRALRRATRPHR